MLGNTPRVGFKEVTESELAPELPDQSVENALSEGSEEVAAVHECDCAGPVELALAESPGRLLDVKAVAKGLLQELHGTVACSDWNKKKSLIQNESKQPRLEKGPRTRKDKAPSRTSEDNGRLLTKPKFFQ